MRRLLGYTLFWIAVGMVIQLLICENLMLTLFLILLLLLVGYNLFVC